MNWDNRDSISSVFTINSGMVKAAVGYIGGKSIDLGKVTIAMDSTEFNWGVVTLTSLDGKPIEDTKTALLVSAGRVENTNMQWNNAQTTVGAGWGDSPSRAEGIPVRVFVKEMEKFTVFALDPNGNTGAEIKVYKKGDQQTIVLGAQHKTLWYVLKRE